MLVVRTNSETKVVLKGNNTVQLTDLATKAGNVGLPYFSVQDAGKTQVNLRSCMKNENPAAGVALVSCSVPFYGSELIGGGTANVLMKGQCNASSDQNNTKFLRPRPK